MRGRQILWRAARVRRENTMNYERIKNAPAWVISEIIWYIKWWSDLFYFFGKWILDTGIKLINLHDELWDNLENYLEDRKNVLG